MAKRSPDILWHGSPSHWTNLKPYTLLLGFIAVNVIWRAEIPALLARFGLGEAALYVQQAAVLAALLAFGWKWLQVHFHHYELTMDVFREKYGILNRNIHELELYRVRDTTTLRPFELNIVGCGNIVLDTTDHSTPIAIIRGVKNPDAVRQLIRDKVEDARARRGIVELGNV